MPYLEKTSQLGGEAVGYSRPWPTGSLTRHPGGPLALSVGIGSRGRSPYCNGYGSIAGQAYEGLSNTYKSLVPPRTLW